MLQQFRQRDARIRRWRDDNEIVLWFEHDLFDQLQLLQILDYFDREPDATGRVSLVQANDYLGPMTPEQLVFCIRFGSSCYPTSSSSPPTRGRRSAHRIPRRFPIRCARRTAVVAPAFRRHLEEFPARSNGLGRTQRQILEVLAAADSDVRLRDAFVTFQRMEDPVFLGDSSFYAEVRALANGATPVLSVEADVAGSPTLAATCSPALATSWISMKSTDGSAAFISRLTTFGAGTANASIDEATLAFVPGARYCRRGGRGRTGRAVRRSGAYPVSDRPAGRNKIVFDRDTPILP